MTAPTVILVGGPPGAGKTTLARALARRVGHDHVTADDLVSAARAVSDDPVFHQMPTGHVDYFTSGPPEKLVTDALDLAAATWPMIERVVASHLRSGSPIVIDWWLLSPSTVAKRAVTGVGSLWLHIDPAHLWERERRLTDFTAGSDDPERMLRNFMHRSLWRNELVKTEAERTGLALLPISGQEDVGELVDRSLSLLRA